MRNAKLFAPKNAKNAKDAKAKLVKNSRKILDMVSYTGNKISIRNTYHSICLGELSRKIPHSIHGTACQPRYCPEYRKTIVGIAGSGHCRFRFGIGIGVIISNPDPDFDQSCLRSRDRDQGRYSKIPIPILGRDPDPAQLLRI